MNIGPSQINLNPNGIYIIVELNNETHNLKIIGACKSYDQAKLYSGPDRSIHGPVQFLDNIFNPQPRKSMPLLFKSEIIPPQINEYEKNFNVGINPSKPNFEYESFYPASKWHNLDNMNNFQ